MKRQTCTRRYIYITIYYTQTHMSVHAVHKNNALHMRTIWASELWLAAQQRPKHQVLSRYSTEHADSLPLAPANSVVQ